jgi:hypothetical protein
MPTLLKVVTPFIAGEWDQTLTKHGLLHKFSDILRGIYEGFDMGISSIVHQTYTPPNYCLAMDNTDAIDL